MVYKNDTNSDLGKAYVRHHTPLTHFTERIFTSTKPPLPFYHTTAVMKNLTLSLLQLSVILGGALAAPAVERDNTPISIPSSTSPAPSPSGSVISVLPGPRVPGLGPNSQLMSEPQSMETDAEEEAEEGDYDEHAKIMTGAHAEMMREHAQMMAQHAEMMAEHNAQMMAAESNSQVMAETEAQMMGRRAEPQAQPQQAQQQQIQQMQQAQNVVQQVQKQVQQIRKNLDPTLILTRLTSSQSKWSRTTRARTSRP